MKKKKMMNSVMKISNIVLINQLYILEEKKIKFYLLKKEEFISYYS